MAACSKEEEKTFADNLEGQYIGELNEYECNLEGEPIFTEPSTILVTKVSDTEVTFSIDSGSGLNLDFSGTISPDSLIVISEFSDGGTTYSGSARKNGSLTVSLGDGCNFAGIRLAKYRFVEN